mmetsp:Transcript_8976/g.13743  ORF Transcript_8976/g.13743 Transcript_8976/m.13743 type:complete len:111 (-) Transcript_8976:81-413(-)
MRPIIFIVGLLAVASAQIGMLNNVMLMEIDPIYESPQQVEIRRMKMCETDIASIVLMLSNMVIDLSKLRRGGFAQFFYSLENIFRIAWAALSDCNPFHKHFEDFQSQFEL